MASNNAPCLPLKLEIRFSKDLAKLTGSAVRINSKKPKRKKEKKRSSHAGVWIQLHPNFLQRPLRRVHVKKKKCWSSIFLCYSHCYNLMELYLSWIQRCIWGKIAQTSISKPFRIQFRVYSLSGFMWAARLTDWSSSSLAEVKVTVLSLLNLPRQGFPATCPTGHCCVCSPLLFASEILCDSPTYNKQRMNKKSLAVLPGNPKCTMTSCWMVDLFMACC